MRRITVLTVASMGLVLLPAPQVGEAAHPGRNGRIVFNRPTKGANELLTISARGGRPKALTSDHNDEFPNWSPDGKKIAFIRGGSGNNGIYTMNVVSGEISGAPGRTSSDELLPSWSPDGRWIVYDKRTERFDVIVKQRANGSQRTTIEKNAYQPEWSPNGRKIAFTRPVDGDFEVFTMRPDGSHIKRITDNGVEDLGPTWAPGGKQLLVSRFSSRNRGDIWKLAADGSWEKRLTDARASEGSAAWSPNGRLIVYVRRPFNLEEDSDLWLMTPGGKFVRRLTDTPGSEQNPDWQPLP